MKADFLENNSYSMLVFERRKNSRIVIGVPHHSPAGVAELPCDEHKNADENSGFIGNYIADKLELCSVIACNYPIDANKSMSTDYAKIISKVSPEYLIEIHGHGGKLARYNVEISSGSEDRKTISIDFANAVAKEANSIDVLRDFTISGDFKKIHFKATNSATITTKCWIPFHIEIPPRLRMTGTKGVVKPPDLAYSFADCIIKAIETICFKQ